MKSARLSSQGIEGDRVVQVHGARGRVLTSRTHPKLLGLRATVGNQGVPLVHGHPWDDAQALQAVRAAAGPDAKLVHDEGLNRFDILPLLVATDGAISALGRDSRRLSPNIVIGGVRGLDERTWPGSQIVVGDVVIRVHHLRGRCIMTTFDPDTLAHDPTVLRDIVKRFGGKLALNCDVLNGGGIQVGEEVEIHRA